MNTYLDSRIITLTSSTATLKNNGTMLSNVEYQMIGLLKEEESIIHTEISVLSAEIPVSFYNINTTNNSLRYIFGAINYLITIPVGNYNATSLITYLNTQFVSPVVMAISNITGKITITGNGSSTIQYLGLTSTTNTLLGFLSATYSSITPLSAPYPMNLLGAKRISICSDLLPIFSYTSVSNTLGNTLATIEIDQPSFGLLLYKNTTNIRSKLRVSTIDVFDIQLKDELNQYLDFNNCDWSITLVLDILRRIEDNNPDITLPSILAKNQDNLLNKPSNLGESSIPVPIPLPILNDELDLLSHNTKK